jgi:hypothetical protein
MSLLSSLTELGAIGPPDAAVQRIRARQFIDPQRLASQLHIDSICEVRK